MRILILHASAGAGHKRAAEALEKAFHALGAEATVSDILDFTPALFRKTYAEGYLRVVRIAPELWGYIYAVSDRKAWVPWRRKVRSTVNAISTRSLRKFIEAFRPDAIVCTHFLPLELLASRTFRHWQHVPHYCVVTDFAVHSLWIVGDSHGFYVATEDARRHLIRRGIAAERVQVSGIPVDPAFAAASPPAAARRRLGLDPKLPTVLVMNGGFGLESTVDLLRSFQDQPFTTQLLVVAGASASVRHACEATAAELKGSVRVFGFVDNIPELMDAADIVVSKPGGLTASEVLAKGKPMIVFNPIPGQEQRNCEYLLEAGAATRLYEMSDARDCIQALLEDPRRLARMRDSARRIGYPHAGATIAGDILQRAGRDASVAPGPPTRESRLKRRPAKSRETERHKSLW